jgi:biotin synthase
MDICKIQTVLERVYAKVMPDRADIEYLLSLEDEQETQLVFDYADAVRKIFAGDEILLRGLIEFSSFCKNACFYCGLNRNNTSLQRYRLTGEQIMAAVKDVVAAGIKTVVLQSGEDEGLDAYWLKEIIEEIKSRFDVAITLSVGERRFVDYQFWKLAGADRYLLKIETTDRQLYQALHPGMSFERRISCSRNLKALGYQNGSGCLVGLKGQTIRSLAEDILFFKKENFEMIGIGLFIPHAATALKDEPVGDIKLALKVLAITRIVTKNTHLPATTAIGSVGNDDGRILALNAGANVLMPNFTPQPYKKLYEIYPGKRCVEEQGGGCVGGMETLAQTIGRTICYSRGDSLKKDTRVCAEQLIQIIILERSY